MDRIKEGRGWASDTKHLFVFKNTDGHVNLRVVRMRENVFSVLKKKDTDGLAEVLQIPVYGSQTVSQFIGTPVQLITTNLRPQKPADTR